MSELKDDLLALRLAAQSMPSPEIIRSVLKLIANGDPYDKLFFETLDDPSWLPVLDHCGYFSNLPGLQSMPDGRKYYPFHLPFFGLTRLAAKAPHAVASILSKLELPENPTVGDQILRCVASIREPTCIPVLHPLLVQLGANPSRSSWIWIHELLKYWIEIKAYSDVLVVLNSYLQASANSISERSPASDEWMLQQVDGEALNLLTPLYPQQITAIVFNALMRYAEQGKTKIRRDKNPKESVEENDLGADYMSSFAVEDFKIQARHQSFEVILAHRLYLASEHIFRDGNAEKVEMLDQLLRSNAWELFSRLRWQLYVDFPEFSLSRARKDVLEQIPHLNRIEFEHYHEFARLLHEFSTRNKNEFLTKDEVTRFFDSILSGPIDKSGERIKDAYKENFQRKQLWPISVLLNNNQAEVFRNLSGDKKTSLNSYQPIRMAHGDAHFIQHVPPRESEKIGEMTNEQLWKELNDWSSKGKNPDQKSWWVQEDYGAFAKKFAELIESDPSRFLPETKWWENLKRPEPLFEPLSRAIERIQRKPNDQKRDFNAVLPTSNDWMNWFGLSKWIISQSSIIQKSKENSENATVDRYGRGDWYWPRTVVSNFLTAAIQSDLDEVTPFIVDAGRLLRDLAEAEDSGLHGLENNLMEEWLTTAINTVRGHAVEGILKLALRQKNTEKEIEPWIFEFICSRLNLLDESPAIFALVGANLRFCVYLFGERLKQSQNILFPQNRPEHERAAIVAHFCFDHPMTGILETFPDFLRRALVILEAVVAEKDSVQEKDKPRDFALQVGVHICFYSWNNALSNTDSEKLLDRFFAIARAETRASVIRQIAWIFERTERDQSTDESKSIYQRVICLWERRYGQIVEAIDIGKAPLEKYETELASFLNWIVCECFAFEWRFKYAMQAIGMLKKMPDVFHLLDKLQEWNESAPERNKQSLQILVAILSRPNDQLRWQIQFKKLAPLLIRGMDGDSEAQRYAKKCQDLLLKMGLFDFLDLSAVTESMK
ncbi:MAG TPA: hypothetical protein VK742_08190 [Candidatus Sulfotelmatobacter sp.]|jgi:hypothetical protein|nr:hypothetical protein [Candidatus Sulfotelmatobacter sp.]